MKFLVYFFLMILSNFCYSQTIINTENMMTDLDENLNYNLSLQGDFNFGNIDLIEFNTAHQFSKSIDRSLIRFLINYEYIEEGCFTCFSTKYVLSRFRNKRRRNSEYNFWANGQWSI